MEPIVRLEGIAAPLDIVNVDTDAIIAVQHVYTLSKSGLGKYLFHRWRFAIDGSEVTGFVLNKGPFRNASILVAGANFGCGSSREHAVWALADYGIRCVIAPSFASIFYENCIKNGILPVSLEDRLVAQLLALLERNECKKMMVDLDARRIEFPDGTTHEFNIQSVHRDTLLRGLDPITVALNCEATIASFQELDRVQRPWVWNRSKPKS